MIGRRTAAVVLAGLAWTPASSARAGRGGPAVDAPVKPAVRIDAPVSASRSSAPAGAELRDGELVLTVIVRPGDTWTGLGQTYLSDLRVLHEVEAKNGGALPAAGRHLVIPYATLNGALQVQVLRAVFPEDGPREGSWIHRAGAARPDGSSETLWQIATWLTGRGENFRTLADRNSLPGLVPARDQEIAVPADLLLPEFAALVRGAGPGRGDAARPAATDSGDAATPNDGFTEVPQEAEPAAPPPAVPSPSGPASDPTGQLFFKTDAQGAYARYRLKQGEALYSVVIRFTGRVDGQEVNDLARGIAERSGIRDLTGIPTGFGVRIPVEDLLPQYLPSTDPRRQAWEKRQEDVAGYTNPSSTRNLEGITVILDAGHGGRDRGAAHNGIAEHEYVYDILCRIKTVLERDTGARVLPTIKDRREGYRVRDSAQLERNQAEILLTDPPFALTQPFVSVNLRWYLTNSYFHRIVAQGGDPLKVVFTSLHADARHPGVGGAMVYVPGEEYRRSRYGYSGAVYARTRESREKPYVSFTRAEREQSEGLSRQFARSILAAFHDRQVAVHPYDPIRERIIRKQRSWVPAVLRCGEVPVEVLIEVSNLSNPADSRLLADPAYRQRVAEAYVDALRRYYGRTPAARPPTRAASPHGH